VSFPAYELCEAGGEDWVGQTPAGWAMTPLKYIADFVNGAAFKPDEWDEVGTPIIRIQNLNGGNDFNFYAGEVDPRHHVVAGDLLFGWSGNRGTSFGPFRWSGAGLHYLNQHIFKVESIRCDKQWLYWCLKGVTEYVEQEAHGIIGMVHVTKGRLTSIKVPLPSRHEQRAIAAFLDRETAKIDALVEAQRRLIELLKEKRQAVISHAVTKGLDPSAPMKDSSVEWLGQVPAHWDLERAKFIFSRSDLPPPEDAEVVTCFRDGQVTLRRNRREDGFTFAVLEVGYQGIQPGQLVLHSMDAFAGAIGVSDSAGKCSPEYLVCDPLNEQTSAAYYGLLLRLMALRGFILAVCPSVRERAPRIRFPDFGDLLLPRPPEAEQSAIAAHIARETAKLDTLCEVAEAASAVLQERRAALISAAVTGKIDVRGLVQMTEAA
jgi:type I restriction enzyme S subunit